jgi:uncharacterized protein (TIGR03437 family)
MNKLASIALLPLAVCAQHVPGAFSKGPRGADSRGPQRTPPGYSLSLAAPVAWDLGPPSAAEAAPRPRYGARQIGVRRAVPAGWLSSAVATTLPDGRHVWLAALRAKGAVALRVHFQDFAVGAGQVWLYDPRHTIVAGPYSGRGRLGTGEFWSAGVASDEVVVEFDAPAGTSPGPPFHIDAISHQWASLLTPAAAPRDTAAPCELDVSCYSDWAKYASGVVMYTFLGDTGGYYTCSGVLLNPAGLAYAPYMLTANHCLSTVYEAATAGLLFGDETSVCDGTQADVQILGSDSAMYLVGAPIGQGDYTLVALTEPAPAGVYLFGWTTDEPYVGEPLVGIHHPGGSWARIAFGVRSADATVSISGETAPANEYYQVDYQQGVVEPGSSGSPLLNSNGEVVGTLTGAFVPNSSVSVCDLGGVLAAYGRLSVAYPAIETYLNGNVNPAPAFSVSPPAVVFNISNQAAPEPAYVDVTTPSLTPVPFSAQVADPWVKLDTASGLGVISPTFINADTNVNLTLDVGDPALLPDGTYKSSVTVTVGTNAPYIIPVTLNIANTQSRVIAAVDANPTLGFSSTVIPQLAGGPAAPWRFVISLTETAGVATKIIGFIVDGQDLSSQVPSLFGNSTIPPLGSVSAVVTISNATLGQIDSIEIDGTDLDSGISWTQILGVQFAGPGTLGSLLASGIPTIVYPSAATPDCPLRQHIALQSTGDAPVTLTGLATPFVDLSSQLASFFGSTYMPVGGSVQGDICWSQADVGVQPQSPWFGLRDLSMGLSAATNSSGSDISLPLGVAIADVPPSVGLLSVNQSAVNFASSKPQPTTLSVDPGSSNLSWNASIIYDQSPESWLSVTPAAGVGPATLKVSVDPAGLIPGGVYRATFIIQSLNSTPQYRTVPVTFQVPWTGIAVVNGASFAPGVAPGMVFSVFGAGVSLAGGTQVAGALPLPVAMQGTTVAVNGIPAPLYYVSPTQLNVQIPYEVPPGPATMTISNPTGQIASQAVYVNAVAPGVFLSGDGRHLAPNVPAKPGGYATLYLTGIGPVSPAVATGAAPPSPDQVPVSGLPQPFARVQVSVNGVPAQTSFVGIPYFLVGVAQINFIVPPGTPTGDQPVTVTLAGVPSNTVYLNIGQ